MTQEPSEARKEIRREDLRRIAEGIECALEVIRGFAPGEVTVDYKGNNDPVTVIDRTVDERLRELLPRDPEGWLSEETADDRSRLTKRRVWIVDPLDGTREFVDKIPEWCVSIGLVEDGRPVAGGICNPATGEIFLGSIETGVTLNGNPPERRSPGKPKDAVVLASRSETKRGEWERFRDAPFTIRPMGSVAYKLACVAGGAGRCYLDAFAQARVGCSGGCSAGPGQWGKREHAHRSAPGLQSTLPQGGWVGGVFRREQSVVDHL